MNWQDTAIIIGLFFLRIGIPVMVTVAIGELISRSMAAREDASDSEQAVAGSDGYQLSPRCWDVVNCDPAVRRNCPAYLRPQVPCWLALQLAGRELPEKCFSCEIFHRTQSVVANEGTISTQGG